MNQSIKIAAYVVLVILAVWFSYAFHRNYTRLMNAGSPVIKTNANPHPPATPPANPPKAGNYQATGVSHLVIYGLGMVAVLVSLGLLCAHDITHYFANRFEAFIFDEEGEALKSPEYDHAEDVWRDGKPLEAIQLLRDFLKENPRKQYVALRIAEIYEKDLQNFLAAALEYEEILKKRLPPERWGWTAIHLANLYSGKLNKITEAEALLHRIVNEYGRTSAAKKARQRLGLPEPEPESKPEPGREPGSEPAPAAELTASAEPKPTETSPAPPAPPASPLPPGFRPKK